MKIEDVAALKEKASKAKNLDERISSLKKAREMTATCDISMNVGNNTGWPLTSNSQYDSCGSPETVKLMRLLYAAIIDCEISVQMSKLEKL